ncbi:DUF885 domain-containing protein [Gallaecimonas xiamenensis]|uniref:Lipoprotein n=1 Tax=Gallaecimonas xiamenensis 3-C-1 TaxID=745411 RepID=K2J7S8_9GAMM|nr:DUF885 domain-containing protein [Gallaecimonas xiamenensis]EKE70972.1 hypothetical protein B3C1_13289 [Gallaecimonas xiamenensis 3-C-1]
MKRTLLCLALSSALLGCASHSANEPVAAVATQGQQQAFDALVNDFIPAFWQQYPTWGLYVGHAEHAGDLEIPTAQARAKDLAFVALWEQKLAAIDIQALAAPKQIDYLLIKNQLGSIRFGIEELKSWQWDPSEYNVAGGIAQLATGSFAPLEVRLRAISERLAKTPAYYAAARSNIQNPTLEHTQLAVVQNQGAFSIINDDLLAQAKSSTLSDAEKAQFEKAYHKAKAAIKAQIDWLQALESDLEEQGNARSFRLGEDLYEKKFAFDIQSGLTAKELYNKALADKAAVLKEMNRITDQLWSRYFPGQPRLAGNAGVKKLIDKLAKRHVARDGFVDAVKAQIPELEAFVNQHQLLTLDPNKPLVVRETPEYMRGVAGASISAPGPYDKGGNTYYNVTPLDGMTDAQAESYLREYNHWMLQVLNIHEAIPGHYAQLVYSNQSPSLVKSLFGNGAMVEGWAVYAERMMLEAGYGNNEPELWLMYYKWNLRTICNTILDYSVHVLNMSEDKALDLLMNDAFQEEAEARGKWRRVSLSQVQLTSYYAGYREIYDFREAQKKDLGDKFDLKAFNEQFLSYGSSPVRYIKALMSGQEIQAQ